MCDIFNEVGNPGPAQVFASLALPVATQIDGMRGEALRSEVIEEMHVPAPGAMHHPVDEQERCWMPALCRVSGDDLQVHGSLVRRRCRLCRVSRPPEPAVPWHGMER